MEKKREIYVYFHLNSFTEEVFYVGIGSGKRPWHKTGRSLWWKNTVSKFGLKVNSIYDISY